MNTNLIIDPTGFYLRGAEDSHDWDKIKDRIIEACGYIPGWAINPDYEDNCLQDTLNLQYGFGLFETEGGTIEKDGIYQYPGDPELYPLIKITRGEETLYQYKYGIVAIVQADGSSFITRMD